MLQENDALSTFCHITAKCIQKAFLILPKIPKVTILTGGGQKNKFLVELIKNYISGKVFTAQDVNLTGDFIESELIAFLAARYHFGLPSTFPSTTGACKEIICGELIRFETK
jgi:anhydro-N-acetylmuramic acid kinase